MLVVEQNYVSGVPQTAVPGWAPAGIAWHWSAGGPGRAGWDGTVRYLVLTRSTTNASYHGGFWCEHAAGHVGCRTIIQWVIPTTVAAHSIAPSRVFLFHSNKDRALQEARFADVRRILGARAADPNAACLAIAYAGMPVDLANDMECPVFQADVQDLAGQLAAHPTVTDAPHFGHGHIQPIDRYEMDAPSGDFIDQLAGLIAPPVTPEVDPMRWVADVRPVPPYVALVGAPSRTRPSPDFASTPYEIPAGTTARLVVVGEVEGAEWPEGSGAKTWKVYQSNNGGFWVFHGSQEIGAEPLTDTASGQLQAALDSANTRTATVKTEAAVFIRRLAKGNTDLATVAESGAVAIEKL